MIKCPLYLAYSLTLWVSWRKVLLLEGSCDASFAGAVMQRKKLRRRVTLARKDFVELHGNGTWVALQSCSHGVGCCLLVLLVKQESLQSTSWIRRCMRSRQLVRHQLNMHTFERAAMDLPISEWDFQLESREIHWEAVLFCWGLTTATHGACKKRFRAGCCCEYAVSFYILFSLSLWGFVGFLVIEDWLKPWQIAG